MYTHTHTHTHTHTCAHTHTRTHTHTHRLFLIGAFLVLVATFMYSKQHNVAVLPTQTDPKGS